MRRRAWWFAITIATAGMSCAEAGDDGAQPFGPVGPGSGASSPAPDDDDDDDDEDTGDDGVAEGPVPPADSGNADDGQTPPPGDDGSPPSDDGGPFPDPSGGDGNPMPPPPPPGTANCDSFCGKLEGCGFFEQGETFDDCSYDCAEPWDMGACDAAWDALAGCLGTLDCNALDMWFQTEQPTACVAETNAADQACAGL